MALITKTLSHPRKHLVPRSVVAKAFYTRGSPQYSSFASMNEIAGRWVTPLVVAALAGPRKNTTDVREQREKERERESWLPLSITRNSRNTWLKFLKRPADWSCTTYEGFLRMYTNLSIANLWRSMPRTDSTASIRLHFKAARFLLKIHSFCQPIPYFPRTTTAKHRAHQTLRWECKVVRGIVSIDTTKPLVIWLLSTKECRINSLFKEYLLPKKPRNVYLISYSYGIRCTRISHNSGIPR